MSSEDTGPKADGARAPKEDRYGLANIALQLNSIGNTLGALALEFDGLGGPTHASRLMAAEKALAGTQKCIAETRHYLRNCAMEALWSGDE